MAKRNDPLDRNDAKRTGLHLALLCLIIVSGLLTDANVNSQIASIQQHSDSQDQRLYRMFIRSLAGREEVAAIECDWQGRVKWTNSEASEFGIRVGDSIAGIANEPLADGVAIEGSMHTCRARSQDGRTLTFTDNNGEPAILTFWVTPEGYIACIEPILPE